MKKMVALLTTVMILAGSVGMAASAATVACPHPSTHSEKDGVAYIETYTHSVQVGTSTSGKPILAACLVEIQWQPYKDVCNICGEKAGSYLKQVYEVHSMH